MFMLWTWKRKGVRRGEEGARMWRGGEFGRAVLPELTRLFQDEDSIPEVCLKVGLQYVFTCPVHGIYLSILYFLYDPQLLSR